jgi:hypothetical protein
MGWRQKFDPTRVRVDYLLERARRLSNIRSLGAQVAGVRRLGMRGEFLVPIVALIILTGALILSAVAPDPEQPPEVGEVNEIPTAITDTAVSGVTATTGYPMSSSPTPTMVDVGSFPDPIPGITATTTFTSTIVAIGPDAGSGYPDPNAGPQPIGTPPGGDVPSVPGDTTGINPPANNPITVPTPPLIRPTTPPFNAYPSPQPTVGSIPRNQPPAATNPRPPSGAPEPTPFVPPTSDVPTPPPALPDTTRTPGATEQPVITPIPETPTSAVTPTPQPTPVPPTPTARPAEIISGNVRWTAADSPVILEKDHALAAGASLAIDPGVDVRFAPGVQFTIAGTLRAQGSPSAPVRFLGTERRWEGIVGTQGSTIVLDQVQIRQAGQTGTAVSSTGGALVIRHTSITDNGGGIIALGSTLDLRNTQISGNAIGGPAVNVRLPGRGAVNIINSIVGGNGTPAGAPQVLLTGEQAAGPITVEGNLFVGGNGPGMLINTNVPLSGTIRCNGFNSGTVGLQLMARRADTAGFNLTIDNNAFERQTTYGATGTLAFNLTNNWWSDPSGPRDAQRNPQGQGVPIGVNLQFQPWLASRPACAPNR